MPTKEDISTLDSADICSLITHILVNIDRYGAQFAVQQMYELFIILVCKDAGLSCIRDKVCLDRYSTWTRLLTLRNVISHNYYNKNLVIATIETFEKTDLLQQLCRDYLGDENLPNYLLMKLGILKEEMK